MSTPRPSLYPVCAAVALLLASAASAGPLIIRATGPSAAQFRPGTRLGEAPVPLIKGDLVVVLDARGTRRFTGPGLLDTRAASKPAEDRIDFSDIAQPDGTRAVIAATRQLNRAAPADSALPDAVPVPDERIWAITPGSSGPHCVIAGQPVTITRAAAAKPATLDLTRMDGGKRALAFAAGQTTQIVPAAWFTQAGPYRLALAGKTQRVTVKLLPPANASDPMAALEMMAQGLASAGCHRQFALLADQIAPARP